MSWFIRHSFASFFHDLEMVRGCASAHSWWVSTALCAQFMLFIMLLAGCEIIGVWGSPHFSQVPEVHHLKSIWIVHLLSSSWLGSCMVYWASSQSSMAPFQDLPCKQSLRSVGPTLPASLLRGNTLCRATMNMLIHFRLPYVIDVSF